MTCFHKGKFEWSVGRKTLVAVDGSPSADRAFDEALNLWKKTEIDLHIVLVYNTDDWDELTRDSMLEGVTTLARRYESDLKRFSDKIDYSLYIIEGSDPRKTILKFAQEYKMETIIVGKHARGEEKSPHYWGAFHSFLESKLSIPIIVVKKPETL
eukprot:TRINITY_DN54719_c0_g1_i2.p1 TRINITY_DN54719_c0_g1~~TRINITY_DN54719_c0_g1_i2.p1  ORF type:complete len:155 (+),score=23.68 TRINITY_DN54719_c0_g1_i2:53-517(+)